VRARTDTSTSNLKNHASNCLPAHAVEAGQSSIEQFAHGSTYQKNLLRVYIDLWIATSYRPFLIVEDQYFVKIIAMLNPLADLPSPPTISRDIKEFLAIGQENLKAFVKVCTYAIPYLDTAHIFDIS
jgi:hypothetical protein